jgi:hypothetical protein
LAHGVRLGAAPMPASLVLRVFDVLLVTLIFTAFT